MIRYVPICLVFLKAAKSSDVMSWCLKYKESERAVTPLRGNVNSAPCRTS